MRRTSAKLARIYDWITGGGIAAPLPANTPPSLLGTFRDWLRAGRDVRQQAFERALLRIQQMDPAIHAWVSVARQEPTGEGPLFGVPFGVKDIIETKDLPTEFGSPVYQGRKGSIDATLLRELRKRGAVLLGKTHTTAFGYRTPGPTRNPHNLRHTPGGSSSGSAAAVAAGMVPFALGTQTWGSTLRPASYCGVAGFKPSYGLLPIEGILPLAPSLDTASLFTTTAEDMRLLWECLGYPLGEEEAVCFGVPDLMPKVASTMEKTFRGTLNLLHEGGLEILPVRIDHVLRELNEAARIVMHYEGARTHHQRVQEYGLRLGPIVDLVSKGMQISQHRYEEAKQSICRAKLTMSRIFETTPVILTPAATSSATRGLASTGDPSMNFPWTALGTPALSIPMPVIRGLPLGLQLVSDCGQDARTLNAAVRIERLIQKNS